MALALTVAAGLAAGHEVEQVLFQRQRQQEGLCRYLVGAVVGDIAHGDAALGGRVEIDGVVADAAPADEHELGQRLDHAAGHGHGHDHDRIGVLCARDDLLLRGPVVELDLHAGLFKGFLLNLLGVGSQPLLIDKMNLHNRILLTWSGLRRSLETGLFRA